MDELHSINTIQQVADYLGVCERTVWNLIKKGELKKITALGKVRITKEAVLEMINQ